MNEANDFTSLETFLRRVPSVQSGFGHGYEASGMWWVKFSLDIHHPLAWNVVQEFGHILNYLSLDEQLPTVFKPVSPPPYMNGGPAEFLSWVIECTDKDFKPDTAAQWLEGRLPDPVEDSTLWPTQDDA